MLYDPYKSFLRSIKQNNVFVYVSDASAIDGSGGLNLKKQQSDTNNSCLIASSSTYPSLIRRK